MKSWRLTDDERAELERMLDLQLGDLPELSQAFVHATYRNEHRDIVPHEIIPLDMLGKDLVTLTIFELLLDRFPNEDVGQVDTIQQVANRAVPESLETQWELARFVCVGKGSMGDVLALKGVLAIRLIGGLYLQVGYEPVRRIIARELDAVLARREQVYASYKTLLQEYVQIKSGAVQYTVLELEGVSSRPLFQAEVSALGKKYRGDGTSKKKAEEAAAQAFMEVEAKSWLVHKARAPQRSVLESGPVPEERTKQLITLAFQLGLDPSRVPWLHMALSHSSARNERRTLVSNDRLIPIGASAIRLSVLLHLWQQRDQIDEFTDHESIARVQVSFLSVEVRSGLFDALNLGHLLLTSRGVTNAGLTPKLRADCLTALIGALFAGSQRGGADPCESTRRFIDRYFVAEMNALKRAAADPTSLLQANAVLFGCRPQIEHLGSEGPSQCIVHHARVTLVDEASGRLTPLTWQSSASTLRQAVRQAAHQGLEELSRRLDLSKPQQPLKLWRAVSMRLLRRLGDKGTRLSVKRRIAMLVGGLGLDHLRTGNLTAACREVIYVLENLERMGLPEDGVLSAIRGLSTGREVVSVDHLLRSFHDLRTWLNGLTPEIAGRGIDHHLTAVMDILDVARSVAHDNTVGPVPVRDIVEKVSLLMGCGLKIRNSVPEAVTVLGHFNLLGTTLLCLLKGIRNVLGETTVTISVSEPTEHDKPFALLLTSDRSMNAEETIARLGLAQALCNIQYGELSLDTKCVAFFLHQPPMESGPAVHMLFADILRLNMLLLGHLNALAPVVHDLKNLLALLRHQARRLPPNELDIPFLEVRNSLVRTTDGLLHYLRSSSKPHLVEVSLHEFLASVLRQVRSLVQGKRVEVTQRVALDRDVITTDEPFLHSIVVNLAKNAIEAMHDSGRLDLELVLDKDNLLLLTVRDTGCGIPPERLDVLFRVPHSTKRGHGGTGLGLIAVSRLVASLGGEISVRSQVGVGTEFAVLIPVGDHASDGLEAESLGWGDVRD